MENELDGTQSLNESEGTVPETVDYEAVDKAEEIANNYQLRLDKAKEKAKQLKAEAEAVERQLKKPLDSANPKNAQDLSIKDIKALTDVHDDDMDSILDWSKFKGISVADAKKSAEMQTLLKIRAEERKTAETANTGVSARSSSKVSDEALVDKIHTYDVPEDDILKAVKARLEQKKKGI